MKDIKAILSKHGEGLTPEQVQSIIDAVNENYRTVEEVNKKTERIEELTNQNEALTTQVANLEGDGEELEKLRAQIETFNAAEEERKAKEAENEKREAFRATFDAAVGERKFANDLMRETIFEKVYATCAADTGAGAKDTIESLTKDMPGVWENPQQAPHTMPNAADITTSSGTEEATKRSFAHSLFGGAS